MENLRENPKFAKFFNLLSRFERDGVDDNSLKNLINLSSPFFKEEKYVELLNIYKILESYFPYSEILSIQVHKLQDLIQQKEEKQNQLWLKKSLKEAKKAYRQKNYRQSILLCKDILKYDQFNITAQKLSEKARFKIMKTELKEHEKEYKSLGIKHLLKFYEALYCLTPESYLIRKKLKNAQEEAHHEQIEQKRRLIDSGLNKIKDSITEQKYIDAIKGAKTILEIDKYSTKAKKLLEKAKNYDDKAMEQELLSQMLSEFKILKDYYKIKKTKFIKI